MKIKQTDKQKSSTFELDLKSKELYPQNCKIKECEETGAAKVEREGSTLWSLGDLLHLYPVRTRNVSITSQCRSY